MADRDRGAGGSANPATCSGEEVTDDLRKPTVGTRKLSWVHVLYNLFTPKNHRVRGRCNICGTPIFSDRREFAKKGLCLHCAEAYTDGLHDRLVQAFNPKLKNWTLIDTVAGDVIARSSGEVPFTAVKKAELPGALDG